MGFHTSVLKLLSECGHGMRSDELRISVAMLLWIDPHHVACVYLHTQGNLSEVHVCLTKSLRPRPCTAEVLAHACPYGHITVLPPTALRLRQEHKRPIIQLPGQS